MGRESMQNSLWGLNLSWRTESQWLARILELHPLLDTAMLMGALNIGVCSPDPRTLRGALHQGHSYIDDFETSRSVFGLLNPCAWMLNYAVARP